MRGKNKLKNSKINQFEGEGKRTRTIKYINERKSKRKKYGVFFPVVFYLTGGAPVNDYAPGIRKVEACRTWDTV